MEQIIGGDFGRNGMKLYNGQRFYHTPSVVGEGRERNLDNEPLPDELEVIFKGSHHFVGRLAKDESNFKRFMMTDDKVHNDTLILALTGLHQMGASEVRLVTGLPISLHRQSNKKELKELLRGRHEITVNGVERTIIVKSVDVVAEGGGAFWSNPQEGLVRIVDGGSKTINACSVRDKRYIDRESDTFDFGFSTNKTENDKELVARIAGELGGLHWKAEDRIYTIGGKAETIATYLKQYFHNVDVIPNALYANAIGFQRIGRLIYGV